MMMKRLLLVLSALGCIGLPAIADAAQTELRMITLQHRFGEELLPIVQPMVGPDGTANAMNNLLIIRAAPDRLAEIEQVVAGLDTARRNIRIEVSHGSMHEQDSSELSVSGRGRIDDAEVVVGNPRHRSSGRIVMQRGGSSVSRQGSQFLTVLDGAEGFIEVGKSVPYTHQWVAFTERYASSGQTIEFRDITTGFVVNPRYIGNEVEVEITPRIATPGNGGHIDFEALATRVRVKPGEWLDLGGTMQSRDEVSSAILGSRSDNASATSSLMIKVD